MGGGDDRKRWPEGMVGGDAQTEVEDDDCLFKSLNIRLILIFIVFIFKFVIYKYFY